MTTQISELGQAQRRVRAVSPGLDRAAVTSVEPVPMIARTQQAACTSLGYRQQFCVARLGPPLRVVQSVEARGLPRA